MHWRRRWSGARAQLELGSPDVDFVALGPRLGLPLRHVDTGQQLTDALDEAIAPPGPHPIEAVIPAVYADHFDAGRGAPLGARCLGRTRYAASSISSYSVLKPYSIPSAISAKCPGPAVNGGDTATAVPQASRRFRLHPRPTLARRRCEVAAAEPRRSAERRPSFLHHP